MRAALLIAAIASAGCLRSTEFKCTTNADCGGTEAACEMNGYCSFTDAECTSGRRYGDFAGSLSKVCVGSESGDGGVDPDMQTGNCPAAYTTLPNAGTHRYTKIGNTQSWGTQRSRCAADATGGVVAYLAVPDDANELQAIVTFANATNTWIGLNDMMTEGTFMTVNGATATFLPWLPPSEPSESGPGEDCVSALMSAQIQTDRCTDLFNAVCECEP